MGVQAAVHQLIAGRVNRLRQVARAKGPHLMSVDNRGEQTGISYALDFQIFTDSGRIRTALGKIDDINPAGRILNGEGLMLWQDRGDDSPDFHWVSALGFLALQAVNFRSADQQRQVSRFVLFGFNRSVGLFHQFNPPAAWNQ